MLLTLPTTCSFSYQNTQCNLPPSYILSIISNEENLIGVSCIEHLEPIKYKIKKLQDNKSLPNGKLKVENIKMVSTNCIKGSKEDYEDIYLQRLKGDQ
jgi:hypothetical protein